MKSGEGSFEGINLILVKSGEGSFEGINLCVCVRVNEGNYIWSYDYCD